MHRESLTVNVTGAIFAAGSARKGCALPAAAADALTPWFDAGPSAVTDDQVEAAVRAAWDALAVL